MVTAATRGACDDTADRPGRPPGRKAALESATDASIIQDAVARICLWKAVSKNAADSHTSEKSP